MRRSHALFRPAHLQWHVPGTRLELPAASRGVLGLAGFMHLYVDLVGELATNQFCAERCDHINRHPDAC
jgi:hypothetical protein